MGDPNSWISQNRRWQELYHVSLSTCSYSQIPVVPLPSLCLSHAEICIRIFLGSPLYWSYLFWLHKYLSFHYHFIDSFPQTADRVMEKTDQKGVWKWCDKCTWHRPAYHRSIWAGTGSREEVLEDTVAKVFLESSRTRKSWPGDMGGRVFQASWQRMVNTNARKRRKQGVSWTDGCGVKDRYPSIFNYLWQLFPFYIPFPNWFLLYIIHN